MNLAVNARDAMPAGGRLTIETANVELDEAYARDHPSVRPGPYVMLAVSDTGVGMDAATRAHVFEPFFTTKGRDKGTGLGLATVHGIVSQSGGNIWLYSEPGRGTTFKIYLPLQPATAPASAGTKAPPEAEIQLRGTETILVVEDDEALRTLAKSTLEDFGYTVITAVDGKDGVEQFLQNWDRIRLVLCDVIMPRMSGGEVRDAIRKKKPDARVLFMSGYPASIIEQKGLLEEGADVVQKPMPPTALLKKVRETLDKK
jgi:CheY-like chemotaxis protein